MICIYSKHNIRSISNSNNYVFNNINNNILSKKIFIGFDIDDF